MRALVTGGAGFIGSHLVDRLLDSGHEIVAYDDFSTGQERFLERSAGNPRFRLIRGDMLDRDALAAAASGVDIVFHFAANADVRFGTDCPERDLQQNAIATFNVLEAMRASGVRRIVFSSTGSVYGEPTVFPTPEDAAVSTANVALRRREVSERGAHPGLLRRFRVPGLHLPLRLDPWRAVLTRAHS